RIAGPALRPSPAQEIPEVVYDDPQEQPHLIRPEAVTGEPRPMGGFLAFLDPLLGRPALVVEVDEGPVRPGERGDDEAHPGEELSKVVLDLGDHPSRPVPGGLSLPFNPFRCSENRLRPFVKRTGSSLRRTP